MEQLQEAVGTVVHERIAIQRRGKLCKRLLLECRCGWATKYQADTNAGYDRANDEFNEHVAVSR